jgi:hypothetical protein
MTLEALEAEHRLLSARLAAAQDQADAVGLWRRLGIADAEQVPERSVLDICAWVASRPKAAV